MKANSSLLKTLLMKGLVVSKSNRFIVGMLGARMHYGVPRILHEEGMLGHFYTDICATKSWPRLLNLLPGSFRSQSIKRLLGRQPAGIPNHLVTAFTKFGFEYARRRNSAKSKQQILENFVWAGEEFCKLIIGGGVDGVDSVYTFNSAGLELMEYCRREGIKTVMEQTIAPYRIEQSLLSFERQNFPEWEDGSQDRLSQIFAEREEKEWENADLIICGSEFVRQSIKACGGPYQKAVVVPYGVAVDNFSKQFKRHKEPLRVLTVGAVSLRKGSPYILSAAAQLRDKAQFRLIGSINLSSSILDNLPENVELLGVVPRSEITTQFQWADVFLLPSICEGSATVTYEAFAAGLPVICTENTGSLVSDGLDGFIVPIRNDVEIADKLLQLCDPDTLEEFSNNAKKKAEQCTLTAYSERLVQALK